MEADKLRITAPQPQRFAALVGGAVPLGPAHGARHIEGTELAAGEIARLIE
jgi:hypothetical protein